MELDEMTGEAMDALQAVFEALDKPFPREQLSQRPGGGGIMLDYIKPTTAIRRMDEAVGKDNWSFEVGEPHNYGDLQQGFFVCTGKMTVTFPNGKTVTKGQMGGCRYGQGGGGMSLDDAAKGAASDALKKCASLFGVALDLTEKDGSSYGGGYQNNGYGQGNNAPSNGGGNVTQGQGGGVPSGGGDLFCEDCGNPLETVNFRDGTSWNPAQLAAYGKRKHGRILDMSCYRKANEAKRHAEEALQSLPF